MSGDVAEAMNLNSLEELEEKFTHQAAITKFDIIFLKYTIHKITILVRIWMSTVCHLLEVEKSRTELRFLN